MRQALVIAVTLLLTSASCSLDMPAAATDLDAAGFWKARIDRDIPAGTSPEEVESYLRANGALEIALSEDRKTLQAAQPAEIKRIFPPIDTKSVRIECSFQPGSGLEECSVYQSPRSCCGR